MKKSESSNRRVIIWWEFRREDVITKNSQPHKQSVLYTVTPKISTEITGPLSEGGQDHDVGKSLKLKGGSGRFDLEK